MCVEVESGCFAQPDRLKVDPVAVGGRGWLRGFEYDEDYKLATGARMWKGLEASDKLFAQQSAAAALPVTQHRYKWKGTTYATYQTYRHDHCSVRNTTVPSGRTSQPVTGL